jgi:alpha-1,3/alpha-1,6-mannosyltransferase
MATIRTLLCTLWIICYGPAYDVVVCDQVSISLLLLKLCGMKTIFYCHFPDKLQSRQGGLLKKFYRIGLDIWEELCIWFADLVYVNSRYTQGIFDKHFTILKRLNVRTEVLYPAIDFTKFNTPK